MTTHKCDFCDFESEQLKSIKRIGKVKYCKTCYINRRQTKYRKLKSEIRQEDIMNGLIKLKKVGRPRLLPMDNSEPILKIKGSTETKRKVSLALTKEEKQLLFRKCMKLGLGYKESDERVKELNEHMKQLGKELRKSNKPDKEKLNSFKEEFERMCREL